MAIEYKGFQLTALPYQSNGSDDWLVCVAIGKRDEEAGNMLEMPVTADEQLGSREEAEQRAIEFGKNVIDGRVPEHSVEVLERKAVADEG